MLNLSCTLMHQTREIKFVPGTQVREEGVPLVSQMVDGKEAVKAFEGSADVSANSKFVGFSYAETLTPVTATYAGKYVTDANGAVLLPYEPITGQISAWQTVDGVRTRIAAGSITIDSDNPRKVVFATEGAGGAEGTAIAETPIEVVFKYMPTLQTAFFEHRVLIPSVSASAMTNSIGVIIEGEVYTDKIDLASDFENRALKLFINAEGNVAAAASVPATGCEIPNAQVIAAPSGTNGFLGIRF